MLFQSAGSNNLARRYTSWAFASTRHFFGDWTVDGQGFTTYLNVTAGSIWVVVARPKAPAPLVTSFDPVGSNSTLWEFEGVLLPSGSQMYALSLSARVSPNKTAELLLVRII
jgi:hypothetical protein